jgi:ubiquinone/menaquinone biosynthesis C-methylase UbiE
MMSINKYKDFNTQWYQDRINRKVGQDNIEILSSGTSNRRDIRFQVLQEIGIKSGDRILDVGCGLGDFYSYLKGSGIDVDYHGVDISSELINIAQKNLQLKTLEYRDFFKEKFEAHSFDFVICSQVLNLKTPGVNNFELAQEFLTEMYRVARKGVACDFVTSYVDFKEDYLFYHSPEDILTFSKTLSKRVTLRHDYPAFEFCIYIYPDFVGWKNDKI